MFVKRSDKDKDADENVDADRDGTGRPVVIGQPTGSSTPFDEVDIDFRVSGLPHAVVKQAENSRVRELENHPYDFIAHNLRKRCIKKGFEGIHDRFQNDPIFRESLLSIDRTEEVCIQMDKDAQKDFTHRMTEDEYFRYKKIGGDSWWSS